MSDQDWRELREWRKDVDAVLRELMARLPERTAETFKQLDDGRERSRDQVPFRMEKYLEQLSPELRQVVEKFYDTANIHVFLVQCGQFNKIGQFWESCKRRVLETKVVPHDMPDFLRLVLNLYNEATPQGEASAIAPEPGSFFDYDEQQRLGEDGVKVREVVLPGLKNPAGKILHKALVLLTR